MQYKVRYRPLERLTRGGWERISAEEQDRLIQSAISMPREKLLPAQGSGKDGVPGGQEQYRLVD
jgi:arginine-tRNA-protein transferase